MIDLFWFWFLIFFAAFFIFLLFLVAISFVKCECEVWLPRKSRVWWLFWNRIIIISYKFVCYIIYLNSFALISYSIIERYNSRVNKRVYKKGIWDCQILPRLGAALSLHCTICNAKKYQTKDPKESLNHAKMIKKRVYDLEVGTW